MLLVFSTNRVKLVARKPETTNKSGQREYEVGCPKNSNNIQSELTVSSRIKISNNYETREKHL